MFKTLVTAAAIALTAAAAQAAPSPADLFQLETIAPGIAENVESQEAIETAYYCQWVTLYDYWGNWVTVWECY